jgi:hypothetical protein
VVVVGSTALGEMMMVDGDLSENGAMWGKQAMLSLLLSKGMPMPR